MSPFKKKLRGGKKKRIVGRKERPEKRKDVHKRELDSSLTENLGYMKEKQKTDMQQLTGQGERQQCVVRNHKVWKRSSYGDIPNASAAGDTR